MRLAPLLVAAQEAHVSGPEVLTLTVSEAARVLGVSRSTAYECVRTGQLRAVRLGRRLVVPRSAIEELLAGPATTAGVERHGAPFVAAAGSSVRSR